MQKLTFISLLLACYWASNPLFCQTSSEIGLSYGTFIYYGDLAKDHGTLEEFGTVFGINYRYMFNRKIGIKGSFAFAQYEGSDRASGIHPERDWAFTASMFESSAQIEYHPIGTGRKNFAGMFNRNKISPYFFFGMGMAYIDPKVTVPEKDRRLFPEHEDPTSLIAVAPIGAGIRFDIGRFALLSLEFGKRLAFSDYLDGISINGNSATNDWYAFGVFGFAVLLGAEVDRKF